MTYFRKPLSGMSSLSGAESCGPDQKWDPNFVFQGIKGQCVPASQPLVKAEGSLLSDIGKAFGALALNKISGSAQPTTVVAAAPAPSGISPTILIAGGLGLVGLVLLMKD